MRDGTRRLLGHVVPAALERAVAHARAPSPSFFTHVAMTSARVFVEAATATSLMALMMFSTRRIE
ncbi:hypothetical protein C0Z17_20040 [Trinickia caryophylli]|nr:hypothetical protein C0Z17_20040 [Trinickia caryophylli]